MKETEVCGQGGDKISQLHLRRAQTGKLSRGDRTAYSRMLDHAYHNAMIS
jgi:hypothetical protein